MSQAPSPPSLKGERVVIVDGTALVYRAFFAIPPHLKTKEGRLTNATFGFASMFKKLFSQKRPRYGAVIFDAPGKTFREEKYQHYKAQRPPMPGELSSQLQDITDVVRVNRFPILRIPGYEADDVIGTLALQGKAAGAEVVIVSSDKDFAQLIGDGVRMHDTIKDVAYDRELVKKKWGVWPEQMVDYLALMGDSVDNIPGVAGIGQKGAQQLLEEHGSLTALLAVHETAPDTLKPRIKKALDVGRDAAILSQSLATIDTAALLPMGVSDLIIEDASIEEKNALFSRLEFYSLLGRDEAKAARDHSQGEATDSAVAGSADDIAAFMGAVAADAVVALWAGIDGEVHQNALRGRLSGVAVGARVAGSADGADDAAGTGDVVKTIWVPVDDARLMALLPMLQDPARKKVVHDEKALRVLLKRHGITLRGVVFDTRLASFLCDPTRLLPHELQQCSKEWLQRSLPVRKDLCGSGKDERALADVDATAAAAFAAEHVACVLDMHAPLDKLLVERDQRAQLTDLELPLSAVLADMELAGIAVDAAELKSIGDELRARLRDVEGEVHRLAGRSFNIGSPKQMGEVLFDELKLPVLKRTKTGYSTDADVLDRLSAKHPICAQILEHRKLDKLLNTYIDFLTVESTLHADHRVRATFQMTTGATGRLITTEPDLQRTPVKTAEGTRIRRAFVATPDAVGRERVLVDADWSQIELRLLAHVSGDEVLVDAYTRGIDIHRKTAAQIFGKAAEDVDKAERDVGKTINFATIYGQGATALAAQLKIERKEAQRRIDQYFELYSGVARYVTDAVEMALEQGFAETIMGRRRIIPELSSKSPMDRGFGERVAVNTPIQGSAADICKLTMLRLHRRLQTEVPTARMLLQIHDELVFECPTAQSEHVARICREEMERRDFGKTTLRVPLVAEVGIGASWGDAK
jgi:DNA polymerase-1